MLTKMLVISVTTILAISSAIQETSGLERKSPTVLIALLIRNKANILPYFFTYLEDLDYEKDRISLWIRSDHNEDKTLEITEKWVKRTQKLYHSVDYMYQRDPRQRRNDVGDWDDPRFADVIRMKEEALKFAKEKWADYIFFLDADVVLTNKNALKYLVSLQLPIVAPMLRSEAMYSNFWGGISENYYYLRTAEYKEILNQVKTGEFNVPMVHSAVLVDTRLVDYDKLTFNKAKLNTLLDERYKGPDDDIITFAVSANYTGASMYISNKENFGYIPVPLQPEDKLDKDFSLVTNILVTAIGDLGELNVKESLRKFIASPRKDQLGFSKIFMINLLRRPERRRQMEMSFDLLGIDVEHIPAVDGKELSTERLAEWGIEFLDGYLDPYHKRPMTFGEIGCFLSHYLIWEKMVTEKLQTVLILEDDIKFEPYFRDSTVAILQQAAASGKPWDLIYFGRKRLQDTYEPLVSGTGNLVEVDYSYWTLGYVISLQGAEKLLATEPLKKLLPVDEFLPIMFGKHPNPEYKVAFGQPKFIAWSASPLLLYPTRYTGEEGYISDTEQSSIIANDDPTVEKKGKKGSFEDIVDNLPEIVMSTMSHAVGHDKNEL